LTEKISSNPDAAEAKKDLGILLELGSIGAGHAATSLSEILQQQVIIDIPRIFSVRPDMLPKLYHNRDMPATAVYIHLEEKLECHFLFIFEMPELKEITSMMARSLSPKEREASMELSATEELGNILIGSFLTAISDFTGMNLISTTPLLIGAPFDSIIRDFVVKFSSASGEALIFDTCFKRVGGDYAPAQLIIFPSPELRELLVRKSTELIDGITEEKDNLELICTEKLVAEADGVALRNERQE
jgi:chemotaxis protein CheC